MLMANIRFKFDLLVPLLVSSNNLIACITVHGTPLSKQLPLYQNSHKQSKHVYLQIVICWTQKKLFVTREMLIYENEWTNENEL